MRGVPPVVRYRAIDGPAYLIGWERGPDGSWRALLAWLNWADNGYRGLQGWADAAEIEQIPGEDYSLVPRHVGSDGGMDPSTEGDPQEGDQAGLERRHGRHARRVEPTDPTDPRDPAHGDRAADRTLIEKGFRHQEPDF